MLRNVLDDYLEKVKEREFDLPLLLVLPLLGYHDIHFTHGPVEFGRDIIAKKRDGDTEVQYSFQSKAGDITQSGWRNEVRGQIETALWSSLSHPNFDASLPHQLVLVATGDLRHNAAIELQEFNATIRDRYQMRSVIFWGKQNLIESLLEHGLNGVYRATAAGFIEFGRFFLLYAHTLQGLVTVKEIETYCRQWTGTDVDRDRRLLLSAIETEVLAQQCVGQDLIFEAAQLHLARLRLLCEMAYIEDDERLTELWNEAVTRLHRLCADYVDRIRDAWGGERDMVKTWFGDVYMMTYPVQCARIIELASLAYFTTSDENDRVRHAAFIREFVEAEPGCAQPISDRHAVSLVLGVLALLDQKHLAEATTLIEQATVWLCDRYEIGMGLAELEADEQSETNRLLGYPFEFIALPRRHESFLATALLDLAAFLGDSDLYSAVVNDIKAVRIYTEYWQPQDTTGACRFEEDDVLHYPSVEFADALPAHGQDYAEHFAGEAGSFRFVERFGVASAVAITALLRDRYFPKLWHQLAPNHEPASLNFC